MSAANGCQPQAGSTAKQTVLQATVLQVVNQNFPPQATPPAAEDAEVYDVVNLGLLDLAYQRHTSDCAEDCNKEPEVLSIIEDTSSTKSPYTHQTLGKRHGPNQIASSRPAKRLRLDSSAPAPVSSTSAKLDPKRKSDGRQKRRRLAGLGDPKRKAEEFQSTGQLNAKLLRISSTGWQGTNYNSTKEGAQLIKQWNSGSIAARLVDLVRIPYGGLKTRIRDCEGRKWFVRTFANERIQKLLQPFSEGAARLVAEVDARASGFTEKEMKGNSRGAHWFSIAGHDRNNKSKPALTSWHRSNEDAINTFFQRDGPAAIINKIMNQIFEQEFPALARQYRDCAKALGIKPLYGYFFNFCLNAPRPGRGVRRVHCKPHVDWKNLAIGICVVFVYGIFNSSERSWLVIWEAGVIIEIPAGVFVMYPSSLFFHFNIDVCDIEVVVTSDGSRPTRENSTPLGSGDGRGSCVWFNQATLFQTAELGFDTIQDAKAAGAPANSDSDALLDKGLFPKTT